MTHWLLDSTTLGHALDRFREHHPGASRGDLYLSVGLGEEVEGPTARAMLGRAEPRQANDDRFILSPDRQGLFALEKINATRYRVASYLRFGPQQIQFADTWWPRTSPESLPMATQKPSPPASALPEVPASPRAIAQKFTREILGSRLVPASAVPQVIRRSRSTEAIGEPSKTSRRFPSLPRASSIERPPANRGRQFVEPVPIGEVEEAPALRDTVVDESLEAEYGTSKAALSGLKRAVVRYYTCEENTTRFVVVCPSRHGRTATVELIKTPRISIARLIEAS